MRWVRIDVGIANDPKLQRLADALKVPRAHAIGLVVSALCQFPDHARDGDTANVPDSMLEDWAGWRGKKSVFATAFREMLCVGTVVSGWDKHNGAAVRGSDTNREKQQRHRNRANEKRSRDARDSGDGDEASPPHTGPRNPRDNPPRNPVRNGETGRDVLKEEERGRDRPPSSAGLSAEFVDAAHRAAYGGARRSARHPDTFDAMLGSLANGMGAPRGKPLSWHQLGTALLQIQGAQNPPPLTAIVIAGFALKVPAEPVKLSLMPSVLPGTVLDGERVVWQPGEYGPAPSAETIAANGWSVAA